MSFFKIKCKTFLRLVSVCDYFSPKIDTETKEKLNVLRLENTEDSCLAVITNQKIAVIERLGHNESKKRGVVHVVLTDALKKDCQYGSENELFLEIETMPEIALGTVRLSSGALLNAKCRWFDETPLDDWRSWGCENPKKADGAMYWDMAYVESLFQASPSGCIYFPKLIDIKQPLTLRDFNAPEWVGLFLPRPPDEEIVRNEASLPEWWND